MSEAAAQVQQITNEEKGTVEQAASVKAAIGAVTKLQAKGVAQAGLIAENVQSMVELAHEQLVFAGTIMGTWGKQVRTATAEWAKQVLAATRAATAAARTATDALTNKS
jgi:hypothetical protein